MAVRLDEGGEAAPYSPPKTATVSSVIPKKMKIVPITPITPARKRNGLGPLIPTPGPSFPVPSPPLSGVTIPSTKTAKAYTSIPSGPANPNTTGLGSQVKSNLGDSLFGLFGSEGVTQGITGTGNGTGVTSGISNIVWIGLAVVLGYFLIK